MDSSLHPGLQSISLLFSYPDKQWASAPLPERMEREARMLIAEMRSMDLRLLENEYVRLFINTMPEVPCAPYGSVYLEGAVMGKTTTRVADIFQKYSLSTAELGDHIAVESEFLAWLYSQAENSKQTREDFNFLLNHLRQWSPDFFAQVEQHDHLGCYRRSAVIARNILANVTSP